MSYENAMSSESSILSKHYAKDLIINSNKIKYNDDQHNLTDSYKSKQKCVSCKCKFDEKSGKRIKTLECKNASTNRRRNIVIKPISDEEASDFSATVDSVITQGASKLQITTMSDKSIATEPSETQTKFEQILQDTISKSSSIITNIKMKIEEISNLPRSNTQANTSWKQSSWITPFKRVYYHLVYTFSSIDQAPSLYNRNEQSAEQEHCSKENLEDEHNKNVSKLQFCNCNYRLQDEFTPCDCGCDKLVKIPDINGKDSLALPLHQCDVNIDNLLGLLTTPCLLQNFINFDMCKLYEHLKQEKKRKSKSKLTDLTEECQLSEPMNISVVEEIYGSLLVRWTMPKDVECIEGYDIYVDNKKMSAVRSATRTETLIGPLDTSKGSSIMLYTIRKDGLLSKPVKIRYAPESF